MEIYIKDIDGKLQETTLFDLMDKAFRDAGFVMVNGSLDSGNHKWIGIVQENKKPEQVTTNIAFNNDDAIIGLNVYVSPIRTFVDDGHMMKII